MSKQPDPDEPKPTEFTLVVFDVDGTLTPAFSIWEHIHKKLGTWYRSGGGKELLGLYLEEEIDYLRSCELDALLWKGQPLKKIQEIVGEISYKRGVAETLPKLREMGFRVVLVSTGLTVLTDRIHREFGLDFSVANHLIDRDGILKKGTRKGDMLLFRARSWPPARPKREFESHTECGLP
jgi:phosphoserine phosphatase